MDVIRNIKCVVWDLDDTLWDGSLVENEEIVPRSDTINLIKKLDSVGIINSVCSKNDVSVAMRKLEELKILNYFVFAKIDFVPKGQSVKAIIANFQLRAENVLFVDDNIGNRNEVEYYCDNIKTIDPNKSSFIDSMNNLILNTKGESRLKRYKILERKHNEISTYVDNNAFLRDSKITACIISNPEDLIFKDRIIDLANRTNQLNFTKSRFETSASYEACFESEESIHLVHGVIFVYDKYGDYGLVGFFTFDERKNKLILKHYYFSCRILNMEIENAIYHYLKEKYRLKPFQQLEQKNRDNDFASVRIINKADERVREYIAKEMDKEREYRTLISAGCASGIVGHYLPNDMKPALYNNLSIVREEKINDSIKYLIHAVYSDYVNSKWKVHGKFSYTSFSIQLCKFLDSNVDSTVYLILASEKYHKFFKNWKPIEIYRGLKRIIVAGKNPYRNKKCNQMVKKNCKNYSNVILIHIEDFVFSKNEQFDPRHFHRIVFKRMCEHISEKHIT